MRRSLARVGAIALAVENSTSRHHGGAGHASVGMAASASNALQAQVSRVRRDLHDRPARLAIGHSVAAQAAQPGQPRSLEARPRRRPARRSHRAADERIARRPALIVLAAYARVDQGPGIGVSLRRARTSAMLASMRACLVSCEG
jgi:hypothetical protein